MGGLGYGGRAPSPPAHAGRALGWASSSMPNGEQPKIIDDDPTLADRAGLSLLLDFSTASLQAAPARSSPLLFLLTSRALEPEQVRQQLTVLCRLKPVARAALAGVAAFHFATPRVGGHPLGAGAVCRPLLVPAFPPHHRSRCAPVARAAASPLPAIGALAISDLPHWLEHKTAGAIRLLPLRSKPAESPELRRGNWPCSMPTAPKIWM